RWYSNPAGRPNNRFLEGWVARSAFNQLLCDWLLELPRKQSGPNTTNHAQAEVHPPAGLELATDGLESRSRDSPKITKNRCRSSSLHASLPSCKRCLCLLTPSVCATAPRRSGRAYR